MASGGRARATVGLPALYHNRITDRSDGLDYAARRRWDRPVISTTAYRQRAAIPVSYTYTNTKDGT